MYYLTNNTFDGVPISMSNHLNTEVELFTRSDGTSSCVNERRGLRDLLFLAEFAREQHGQLRRRVWNSRMCRNRIVSGSTMVYSQCRSSLT